ncbi:MAG: ATP-binding cassette domain-containing protein [Bacteroidales bacterium]|nr:ATP-binding cassette domain-containing protein [Bacteroidales bacterium]
MNESILNALMHMFAIVANVNEEGVSDIGRSIVESYLRQHVAGSKLEEYLKLFDNYINYYHEDKVSPLTFVEDKKIIKNDEDLKELCIQLTKGLHQKERIIIYLRLLEFVNEDNIVTDKESEILSIIAESFNIDKNETNNCKAFILDENIDNIENDKVLVIESEESDTTTEFLGLWFEDEKSQLIDKAGHLYIDNFEGKINVLFLKSINLFIIKYFGTSSIFIKRQSILPGKFYILDNSSIIKGHEIAPVYYADIVGKFIHTETKKKIVFTGEKIEFQFKNSNNGIQKFSFSEESSQLISILGGSGVGKSTLLNILNGKLPLSKGKIDINGFDIYKNKTKLKGIIGYVPQDDLLFEELTVYQNLYYNAKLCFSNFSKAKIKKTVENMLHDLELTEIKDLTVGNPLNKVISGGQRKRINIALELMREPSILLIDEPTSGLSSMDSEIVINLLKQQALKGKLIIANIHQPSSDIFKLFDKLWLLDKGGYLIYSGNPIEALEYFKNLSANIDALESECPSCGNVNVEQILQIVESRLVDESGKFSFERKTQPKEWYDHYCKNFEKKFKRKPTEKKLPLNNFIIPDINEQFQIFSIRNLLTKLTNKQYLFINLLEAPVLALILSYFTKYISVEGYIFSDNKNIPAYLFMSIIVALFIGLTVSSEEIIKDRKILERESFLNLSWFSYINSKIVFLFLVSAIQAFTFVLVGNMVLEIKGMMFSYWLILFSTSCFANIIGLNISSGLDSVISIYILIPFILIPQIMLSGVIVRFDDLHKSLTKRIYVPVVGDLMISRWSYEAMAVKQFKDNKYEKFFYEYEKQISDASYNATFLIPKLQLKVEECDRIIKFRKKKGKLIKNLELIKNEIKKLEINDNIMPFEYIDNLVISKFNEEIAEETFDYLEFIKINYSDKAQKASSAKDKRYNEMVDSLGKDNVYKLMQDYYNKNLAEMVLNKREILKIWETKKRLVQKKDPIFMYPESNLGRAHFYSPVKKINEQYFDTFWFNLLIIWIFTFVFYFTLLTDTLRKLINYSKNISV